MQKLFLSIGWWVCPLFLLAQAPEANNLVKIHNVTSIEREAITDAEEGMLVYDINRESMYTYTASAGWQPFQTAPNVYVGAFIIKGAGTKAVTGIPFKPTSITFTAHANIETYNIDNDNGLGNNVRGLQNSFGAMEGFARDDDGTISQQVIFSAGHGNSINDISRFASDTLCIGVRFGHQNGDDLGKIIADLDSFDDNGFTMTVTYTNGTLTDNNTNPVVRIQPDDVQSEDLVVLFTAYR